MTVVTRRISVAEPSLGDREAEFVADCMASGWVSAGGPYNRRFESEFASFCGVSRAATCANGTVALHLALLALGVGPGDEVIVPTLTYVATANAVRYCGATPVFADSEPVSMGIAAADVDGRVTPRTRAVIAVHLYGHPVSMDPLREVAARHGLAVLEDAAEAHGARYHGRRCGALGDVATFSFFGNKIITTGEGGMVTSDDTPLMERVELLRGQGMDPQRRYWFPIVGYNYRMTNLQAALGTAQMQRIDELLGARRRVAAWYRVHLAGLADRLELPDALPGVEHVFWMYTVLLRDGDAARRDRVMAAMESRGIETRPVFHPVHTLPPYRTEARFPVAEIIAARGINLPTHPNLTEDDVVEVSMRLTEALDSIGN